MEGTEIRKVLNVGNSKCMTLPLELQKANFIKITKTGDGIFELKKIL